MSSSCSHVSPVKRCERAEQAVDELLAVRVTRHQLAHAREPEHGAIDRVRLGDPVAVQQEDVPRRERRLPLLVAHAGHRAERHPGRAQLDDRSVGTANEWQVVAGVREAEPPGRRLENGVEAGDEHVVRDVGVEEVVGPFKNGARRRCAAARRCG